ncbi:latexin isoform X2 [Manacus candei]|uniref:latexin isoform X2 n=1 Tax=Manacus candei TaxID=415023 RepID=UPI002226D228|nr:latexin isoform X2 [Manacus candei]
MELPPAQSPSRRAAAVAVAFLRYRRGGPARALRLRELRRARTEDIKDVGHKYYLELELEDVLDKRRSDEYLQFDYLVLLHEMVSQVNIGFLKSLFCCCLKPGSSAASSSGTQMVGWTQRVRVRSGPPSLSIPAFQDTTAAISSCFWAFLGMAEFQNTGGFTALSSWEIPVPNWLGIKGRSSILECSAEFQGAGNAPMPEDSAGAQHRDLTHPSYPSTNWFPAEYSHLEPFPIIIL